MNRLDEVVSLSWSPRTRDGPRLIVTKYDPAQKRRVTSFERLPIPSECGCYAKDVPKVLWAAQRMDPNAQVIVLPTSEGVSHDKQHVALVQMALPTHIGLLRDALSGEGIRLLESDIKYGRRVAINCGVKIQKEVRPIFLDIETDPRVKGKLGTERPEQRLLSFAYINDEGEHFDTDDNEIELMKRLGEVLLRHSLLLSWSDYERTYPIARARMLGLQTSPFLIEHVDLMQSFCRWVLHSSDKHQYVSLFAAADRLKINYKDYGVKGNMRVIWDFFQNDRGKLRDYNVEDVRILKKLDERGAFVDSHVELATQCGTFYSNSAFNSTLIDTVILRLAYESRPRVFLPNKWSTDHPEEAEELEKSKSKFRGAVVFDSTPGLHQWIAVLDFSGLYPSLIKTFNIGVDTLRPDGDLHTPCGHFTSETKSLSVRALELLDAWIDRLSEELEATQPDTPERERAEAKRYAVKSLRNSMYGVTGSVHSRLYDKVVAESVTQSGVACVKKIRSMLEAKGYTVIYGDTDSVFVKKPDTTFTEQVLRQLADECNRELADWIEQEFNVPKSRNCIRLAADKVFEKFFMAPSGAAKKYMGWVVYDKKPCPRYLKIQGFETKRQDTTALAKRMQRAVFEMILGQDDQLALQRAVRQYAKEIYGQLKAGELDNEIVFSKSLKKDVEDYAVSTPHVRAAKQLQEQGLLNAADRVRYVWVNKKEVRAVADKVPKIEDSGYEYVWEHSLAPMLERLGFDVYDVAQTNLDALFRLLKLRLLRWRTQ